MDEVVKITVWVPDQQALNEVLSQAQVSLECGSPKKNSDDNFEITLYASPDEAKKITALSYQHQIDEHYGEVLGERRKEVSQVDRFEGGKIKPTGLGVKR